MAEEEKTIELPVEPVVAKPPPKRSNTGVIILSVFTGITCLIIIYYVFIKKDKMNAARNFNGPVLNSRTISSNGGYGGNFNRSTYY